MPSIAAAASVAGETLVHVYRERDTAQRALAALRRAGFREDQMGIVMRHFAGSAPARQDSTGRSEATGDAWPVGVAAGLLPQIGPVIAGGLLGSVLAGAVCGTQGGNVAAALTRLHLPGKQVRDLERKFEAGYAIIVVRANGRTADVDKLLDEAAKWPRRLEVDAAAS